MNDFYRNLNRNKDDDRWSQWLGHRYEINELINRTLKEESIREDVIILGAGNCDDLDLTYLGSFFNTISLVDIDGESTKKAFSSLEWNVRHKVKIIKDVDFTKLDQIHFYSNFQKLLDDIVTADHISSFLRDVANEISNYDVLANEKRSYSLVISSAVYTQLFYIQALTIFHNYTSNYHAQHIQQIIEELKMLRNELVKNYNDTLASLVTSDGSIIVWTDVIKIDASMEFIEESFYFLQTEEQRLQYVLKMVSTNGIEAATVGLKHLYDKLNFENRFITCWIWPFNNEKKYVTMGIRGKIKSNNPAR